MNIYEKLNGKENIISASAINNIGAVYHSMGNYENALKYYH